MEEFKIYTEQGYNYLQKALPIAKEIAQEYLDTQNANQSTKDSIYLAMNKQKCLDRLNTKNAAAQGPTDSLSQDGNNSDDSSSKTSSMEYDYSSSEDDTIKDEIQSNKATAALSNMSLSNQNHQSHTNRPISKTKTKKSTFSEKLKLGTPPLCTLPLQNPSNSNTTIRIMELPLALLSSSIGSSSTISDLPSKCHAFLDLSHSIHMSHPQQQQQQQQQQPILILLVRSGRFAGAIFQGPKCLAHRVCTQYTVRRGQGGAQSSSDNRKKAKSMGAQLRRAGEEKLKQDILLFLKEHQRHVQHASMIFQSCPKTMQSIFGQNEFYVKAKQNDQIRKIPLSVGRPTYEMACQVYSTLMTGFVRDVSMDEYQSRMSIYMTDNNTDNNDDDKDDDLKDPHENGKSSSKEQSNVQTREPASIHEPPPKSDIVPLTPLHKAAASGNLTELTHHAQTYLSNIQNENDPYHDHMDINIPAGEKQMTALHYAASSNAPQASECIIYLLQSCRANPCCLDSHNRPPYYVASSDKIREAFRLSRSQLGEDYCQWDSIAKVGPALSMKDIQTKKQKLAEKKKRQRQRQKEKKAKERMEQQKVEEQRKKEEEQTQMEMDAKRSRAGLAPKKISSSSSPNACDYCGKSGMKRSQMFSRLDFLYCSMDCVKKHQRELAANAALARFGGA